MPPSYTVIISPRAQRDLHAIHKYIARDSAVNADRFIAELLEEIDKLQILPHRYRIHRRFRRIWKSLYRMPIRTYLVYYRVDDSRLSVEVITVRHGMRRQP